MKAARFLIFLCLSTCLSSMFASRIWDASASRKYNFSQLGSGFQDAKADSATGFDVQKYEITLAISQNPNFVEGNVLATVLAEQSLNAINYELVGLAVSQVLVNGNPATYTHTDGILSIAVNASPNQTFETQVFYSGTPQLSGGAYNVGMYFQTNSIFTISDPDAGRYWWPCYDHPWDKAVVDLIITMRSDWMVAANGLREGIVDNGNGTATTTWRGQNPMTTYLVCITAGPYQEIVQSAMNGQVPIQNFVTQNQYNNALVDFANLPAMIDYFSTLFGAYPFEKYGNATVSMSTFGAMEHQTMTTLGNYIITGNQTHELTVAHELAHQWYGNAVSFLDFPHVWLSEGFATYSEHLWVDHEDGWQAACNYVLSNYHQYYTNWENSYGAAVIYNPSFGNYFAPPSYEKAASVLHMLRLKMGDAQFFQLLQQWFSTYRNGNVVTAEFQAMAESISGLDLAQFFQQWIYGSGIPSVTLQLLHKEETSQLKVIAQSSSPTATSFAVDFPIKLSGTSGSDSLLVHATADEYINLFSNVSSFDELSLNHNNWTLLREISEIRPRLISAIGYSESARLQWEYFPGVECYEVYYRTSGSEDWIELDVGPIHLNYATLHQLNPNQEYEFMIRGMDNDGFLTRPSNILTARPVYLDLYKPLLVVDETRDGSGTDLSPDDSMVDDFYAAAISPYEYDEWDVATQGLPTLDDLSAYHTVIWHADDFTQNLAFEAENTLLSYIYGCGNLIFSGWRSMSSFSEVFWLNLLFDDYSIYYDNAACLTGLICDEYNDYPPLAIDQTKLAAPWNGMLPMINTFDTHYEGMYYAEMPEGFNGANKKAGIKIGNSNWLMGFPLFYMEEAGVRNLMQNLLAVTNTAVEDAQSPAIQMALSVYPNPFNPSTKIQFNIPNAGNARLKLYNVKGQLLEVLADELYSQGKHNLAMDMSEYASGIYILSLESAGKKLQKRITLMK